jgi:lactoylglutathione lyase
MRGLVLFVAGTVAGLAIQMAIAQGQNRGVVGVNHVGISVQNLDEAVTYYTETLGFPEAFRVSDDAGVPVLVYVQVSRDTFVELQPANPQRPPGLTHFGVHVEDMAAAAAMFNARGASVTEPRRGSTNAVVANITDPNGIRVELLELPPESLHRKAMEDWR